MKTLLLVDLSGLWRMNWHSSEDQEIGAAYSKTIGAVRSLTSRYSHSAICLDMPPYKRREVFPAYKAQREAPTPQMLEQFARVKERLTADGLLLWGVPGYEADDIIATATKLAPDDGDTEVFIASSDKDLLQLVSENVFALSFKDLNTLIDAKAVAEKFGVAPQMMGDLLALMGDKSDNLPGIEGVGPKKAAELLKHFGTFEDVLERASEIRTPALRENVLKGAASVRVTRKLVALATDAPINFDDIFQRREPKPLSTTSEIQGFDEAEFEDEPKSNPKSEPPPATGTEAPAPATGVTPRAPASTALAVRPEAPKDWALQLEPGTTRDAWTMAKTLHDSRLFVQFPNAQAIFAVILRGRSLGIDAVTSLSNFHIVEGRPTMHAALIIGLVLKSGKAEYFDLVETTDLVATWATKRKGARHETKLSWGVEDALNAGLLVGTPDNAHGVSRSGKPSNWDKYRRTMMRWRGGVELARAVYPDITTGIYTPDEAAEGAHDPAIEAKYEAA